MSKVMLGNCSQEYIYIYIYYLKKNIKSRLVINCSRKEFLSIVTKTRFFENVS